jgi:enoyl-CoA hydratase
MTATDLIRKTAHPPHVLQLTLNRIEKRNALSNALIAELAAVLEAATADDTVRAVVLSGREDFFSSGADIKEMQQRGFEAISNPRRVQAWNVIATFPKPLIAAIDGVAYGGGHELALLADIIIAGSGAKFAQPEISIGILPGDGATQRLARIAGKSLTMLMTLTGEPIDAATALRAGLVAEVVADKQAVPRALDIARTIAIKSPIAARLAKEAILAANETMLSAGLAVERSAIRHAFTTQDQREGMAAFFEKRAPRYQGK